MDLDPRLQELLDHHEIRQLLATYCHGCDRGDEVEMASIYAEESWDDHGPRKMEGRRFAIETAHSILKDVKVINHMLGQSTIKVDGETAAAETYYFACTIRGEKLNQTGGRYVDRLVREGGRWKIKSRICVGEWQISHPYDPAFITNGKFVEARWGQEDPSYAALGLTHSGNPWLHEAEMPA